MVKKSFLLRNARRKCIKQFNLILYSAIYHETKKYEETFTADYGVFRLYFMEKMMIFIFSKV